MDKIWLQYYPAGVPADIEQSNDTLVELFEEACRAYSNNKAITCNGESLSFAKTCKYVDNLAASLVDLGVTKGDRVAIALPNIMQYPISLFAILKIGAIVVNINPLYTPHEMDYILSNSGAKVIIIFDMLAKTLNTLYNKNNLQGVIVTQLPDLYPWFKRNLIKFVLKYIKRADVSYSFKAHNYRELTITSKILQYKPEIKPSDIAFIQYTGATTGKPKGAMLSHANIVANVMQIRAWIKPWVTDLDKQVAIDALPLYHIFSLTSNLFTFFFVGSENVMIPNPRASKDVLKTLLNTPFTIFNALDTLYNHLLNYPPFLKHKYPTFKYSVSGGMVARDSVSSRWYDVTGVMPSNCYGLTETSPAITMNTFDGKFDGSVGFPIPSTDIQIRHKDTKSVLANGEIGLIFVKGPQVMLGYWNNPEKTKLVLDEHNWLDTGDFGYLNQQGKLFISGRQTEMVIVSGFNVYPVEVETTLDMIAGIKEAAIVGNNDNETGEKINAFVVLKPGILLTEKQIVDKCRETLTSYKIPRQVFIVPELPKTLVGKIDKVELFNKYLKKDTV